MVVANLTYCPAIYPKGLMTLMETMSGILASQPRFKLSTTLTENRIVTTSSQLDRLKQCAFVFWPTGASPFHSQSRDMAYSAIYFVIVYYRQYLFMVDKHGNE